MDFFIFRKIKHTNLPSTSELIESKLKVDNTERESKDHVELKKILVTQSSSVNPSDKFEDSCQLTRLEELTENSNNFQSHEYGTIQSVTPIESCFHCPKDTPSLVDQAVHSAIIGSDHSTKEEQNRKEFYYTVKAKVEKAVKVNHFYVFYSFHLFFFFYTLKFLFFFLCISVSLTNRLDLIFTEA